jgi:hypothetical protein
MWLRSIHRGYDYTMILLIERKVVDEDKRSGRDFLALTNPTTCLAKLFSIAYFLSRGVAKRILCSYANAMAMRYER